MSRLKDYDVIPYGHPMSRLLSPSVLRIACASLALFGVACGSGGSQRPSAAQEAQIRAQVEHTLRDAYDLSKPDVSKRMLDLYADSGAVISAAGGSVISSRDSL